MFTRLAAGHAIVRESRFIKGENSMPWTTPKTWVNNDPLTASDMNTHIRDNLNALKAPPTAQYTANEASNYQTTGTTFASVDATNLNLSITTTGGDVLIGFHGTALNSTTGVTMFDVLLDNTTRLGGDDGFFSTGGTANLYQVASFVHLVTGLSAGTHNFKLQWRVSSGTTTLYAGAGTANADTHPQFWVREV
jgi:hypothetical protein